jgi:hypothetical protein
VFVAGAVCPHPPLLVPDVAQRAAPELDELRAACADALTWMLSPYPDAVVCVGDGPGLRRYDEADGGSMRSFGVDVRAGGDGSDDLPLSLTIGAWLLDRAEWRGRRRYVSLPEGMSAGECVAMGRETAAAERRVAVLAMGDGSAKRSAKAPGYVDERAEAFDAEVARALGGPDLGWLTGNPSPADCAELWVAGRQAWQLLAGAATHARRDYRVGAHVSYDAAPYGVGYFVARWFADLPAG